MKHLTKRIFIISFSLATVFGFKIILNSHNSSEFNAHLHPSKPITSLNTIKNEPDRKIASVFKTQSKDDIKESKSTQENFKEFGSGAGRAFFIVHPFKLDLEYALYFERSNQNGFRNIANEKNLPQINVFKHWGVLPFEDRQIVH